MLSAAYESYMLSVNMLIVVMLSVVAPFWNEPTRVEYRLVFHTIL